MRRFNRRPMGRKRMGQWCGTSINEDAVGTDAVAFPIWDVTDSQVVNMAGVATTRRIVGDVCFYNSNNNFRTVYWYVQAFPTNDAGAVPTAIITDPQSIDPDAYRKRVLAYGSLVLGTDAAVGRITDGAQLHLDIKSRHKFTDQDTLFFVAGVLEANTTGNVFSRGFLRAYASW